MTLLRDPHQSILSDLDLSILFGIHSSKYSAIPSVILSSKHSDILFGIQTGTYSDILFEISPGILSVIQSCKHFDILSRIFIWHSNIMSCRGKFTKHGRQHVFGAPFMLWKCYRSSKFGSANHRHRCYILGARSDVCEEGDLDLTCRWIEEVFSSIHRRSSITDWCLVEREGHDKQRGAVQAFHGPHARWRHQVEHDRSWKNRQWSYGEFLQVS